jgi:muconolactone delta-isomerase
MAGKSVEQRLQETDVQIRQLQAKKDALARQLRQQERKDRTRRLIQIGGIMARLGIDTIEKAQAFQRVIEHVPEGRDWLQRAIQPVPED